MSVIWSGITEEGAVVPVQVTEEGKVVAVGDGAQGDYLPITGGNLTGDLTIDTDKVTLNAADGSITAASTAYFGSYQSNFNWNGTDTVDQATLFVGGSDSEISGIRVSNTNYAKESEAYLDLVNFGSKNLGVYSSYRLSGGTGVTAAAENDYFKISRLKVEEGGTTTLIERLRIDNDGDVFIGNSLNADGSITASGSAAFAGGKCGFTSDGELIFSSRGTRYKLFVSQGVCQAEEYTRQMELKEKADQFIADKRETKPSEPQPEATSDNDNA